MNIQVPFTVATWSWVPRGATAGVSGGTFFTGATWRWRRQVAKVKIDLCERRDGLFHPPYLEPGRQVAEVTLKTATAVLPGGSPPGVAQACDLRGAAAGSAGDGRVPGSNRGSSATCRPPLQVGRVRDFHQRYLALGTPGSSGED